MNGVARYYYDGNGTMVKSMIGDVVTYYPSSAFQEKMNADTGIHNERKYYAFGNTTVAMRENDVLTWLLTDQINSATAGGDTTVTASEDRSLAPEIKYTAFGGATTGGDVLAQRRAGDQ